MSKKSFKVRHWAVLLAEAKRGVYVTMKEIPLTQDKIALVDDDDYGELCKFKWHAYIGNNTWYAKRNSSMVSGKRHTIKMHTAIICTPLGMQVDHINGNGLDNRRENLRIVTCRQNGQNLHIQKSSKYPGVSWNKNAKKWQSTIRIDGKKHHLGYSDDEFTAYSLYCVKSGSHPGKRFPPSKKPCIAIRLTTS